MFRRLAIALLVLVPLTAVADAPPTYPDKTKLLVVRDADGTERPITDAAGWAKRRAHTVANVQRVMGPMPDDSRKEPLEPKGEGESDQGKFTRYKMTIAVEKGDRLPLYLLVPKKRDGKLPAVVCLHPTSRD